MKMMRQTLVIGAVASLLSLPSFAGDGMTEEAFAEMMAKPESGFDAMAPENVSPLVAWLGSADAADVTGRVFEVQGGQINVADGWRTGPGVDKGARWEAGDIGAAVRELIASAPEPQKVYGT